MATTSFQVRLVTGLVTRGARLNGPPEREGLRPSSLRGGMRYWFRALAGSCFAGGYAGTQEELQAIRTLEGDLFGTTFGVSPFSVESSAVRTFKSARVSMKPGDVKRDWDGLRPSTDDIADFHVMFRFRSAASVQWQEAILGSWRVFCLLSGDGQRKRRGLGSLGVLQTGIAQNPSQPGPEGLDDIAARYRECICGARSAIGELLKKPPAVNPLPGDVPPALSAQAAKVWLVAPTGGDGSPSDCWQWFYKQVYTPYKAGFDGHLGSRYGAREGALPSPFLFSIKQPTADGAPGRSHAVLVAWFHLAYKHGSRSSYFADNGGNENEWGRLEKHLADLRSISAAEFAEVPLL